MKQIPIKTLKEGSNKYYDGYCFSVMSTIRNMQPGEIILFPADWNEAVRTSTSILRSKENMNVKAKKVEIEDEKYMRVEKGSTSVYTFNYSLSPTEPRLEKPYDIIISLMGADVHLATIKMGPTKVSEDMKWYAECTIHKGSAISNEFWEANGKKIRDYICSELTKLSERR
mgnify:CR=1 FL=1